MIDVLVVGAGPAGSVAALVLARGGARVRLIDRATFPRPKLCGDTVNPGTLAALRSLGVAPDIEARGLPIHGMRVTGPHGIVVEGRYPRGLVGRSLVRRDLDWLLLQQAVQAGVQFEPGLAVRRAIVDGPDGARTVRGVVAGGSTGSAGRTHHLRAAVTIAADGRRSPLAFGLGLAAHPARPRRWAIGVYFDNAVTGAAIGEMHVRHDGYIGVAPVPDGLTNVCVVRPAAAGDLSLRDPAALVQASLSRDPLLAERFAAARAVAPPMVLGPLAVDVSAASIDGLLLAGDAAGFVDPMTGDGLRFAVRGGELAAAAALDALAHGWSGVHARLARARRLDFAAKVRFNRVLRALVAAPRLVDAAAIGARVAPALLRAVIARAGDCAAAGAADGAPPA
jgi:flavin-dependent dehydrogenase